MNTNDVVNRWREKKQNLQQQSNQVVERWQNNQQTRAQQQQDRAWLAYTQRQNLTGGGDLTAAVNKVGQAYNAAMNSGKYLSSQDLDRLDSQLSGVRDAWLKNRSYFNEYKDLYGDSYDSISQTYTGLGDLLTQMQNGINSARQHYGQYADEQDYNNKVGYARQYAGKSVDELQGTVQQMRATGEKRLDTDQGRVQRRRDELYMEAERARQEAEDTSYSREYTDAQKKAYRDAAEKAQREYEEYAANPFVYGNDTEINWIQNFIDSGDAAYYAGAQEYGVDLNFLTPYEVVQWADDPSRTKEQKAWAQNFMASAEFKTEDGNGAQVFGEQEYRAKAALQHEYEQRRAELTDQQRDALDAAIRARLDARNSAETSGGYVVGPTGEYTVDITPVLQSNATLDEIAVYAALTGMTEEEARDEVARLSGWTQYQEQLDYLRQTREAAAGKGGGIYTVKTWATQPFANWEGRLATWGAALSGEGLSSSDPLLQDYLTNQTIRQTRAEVWSNNPALKGKTIFGQDAGAYVYNTINSMVDSWVNRQLMMGATGALGITDLEHGVGKVIGALVSDAVMGSGAATQTYIDYISKGYSPTQALAVSAVADFTEALTEWIGGEEVMKYIIKEKYGLKAAISQFMSEGLEELAGNWVNDAFQAFYAKDPEAIERVWARTLGLVNGGVDPEKAFEQAFIDVIISDAGDFVAGGLAALGDTIGSRVVRAGNRAVSDYRTGREMIREGYRNAPNVRTINEGLEMSGLKGNVTEKTGSYQLGRAVRRATETRTQTNAVKAVREATPQIRDALVRQGIRQEMADRAAGPMAKQMVMQLLQERGANVNEKLAQVLELDEAETELLQRGPMKAAYENVAGISENASDKAVSGAYDIMRKILTTLQQDQVAGALLDKESAAQVKEGQDVRGFIQDKQMVRAAAAAFGVEGREEALNRIKSSKTTITDEQAAAIYDQAAREAGTANIDEKGNLELPKTASDRAVVTLKQTFNAIDKSDSKSREDFSVAGLGAYNLGLNYGGTEYAAQVLKSLQEAYPDVREQLQTVYDAGIAERQSRGLSVSQGAVQATEAEREQRRTSLISKKKAEEHGVNTVDFDRIEEQRGRSGRQMAQQAVRMARMLSRVLNVDIVFFDSRNAERQLTGKANGWFDVKTGTVYLDITSGLDNGGSVTFTLAHELTHVIAARAGDHFQRLENFVVDYFYKNQGGREGYQQAIRAIMGSDSTIKTEEAAREELVARSCENMLTDTTAIRTLYQQDRGLWGQMKRIIDRFVENFNRIVKSMQGDTRASARYAQALAESAEAMRELQRLWDAGLVAAAQRGNVVTAQDASVDNPQNDIRNSIKTTSSALGVQAYRDAETGRVSFFLDGKAVSHVNAEHIKNHSGIGVLIKASVAGRFISASEAETQYRAAADLMNMIMKTEDPELIWAWAGSEIFSALKKNSDGQYGTTIDFTTVCRKTQEMVTAMSTAMKKLGRGLTKAEVTDLQYRLSQAGAEVPCPVCYVFSRWAGIGGMLDNIMELQNKYGKMGQDEVAKRVAELEQEIIDRGWASKDKRGRNKIVGKNITELLKEKDQQRMDLAADIERAQLKKQDTTEMQKQLDELDIERGMLGEWTWVKQIMSRADYKPVPADVLFDLNAGARFAQDYPAVWRYRTTRGPSSGKAILPYSDMRFGDIILGADAAAKRNTLFADKAGNCTTEGTFTKDQLKAYKKALARTAAQNLIGGQRFQSTSDFRYEYALDYIQSFWELQALGSKLQTYTKVVEYADIIAAIGGDVNLSVMPRNKGFRDGKLIFSNVTGMNIDAAKEAVAKLNNNDGKNKGGAQLILVGINDEHIMLALDDNNNTGGEYVGFVIPYHASGASIEDFISELVKNLGENFVRDNYQDYSDVQTDSQRKDATDAEKHLQQIRKDILTGKKISAEDLALIRGTSADISNRSFEDLLAVEQAALNGDADAMREYLSWSAGVLNDLYAKMTTGSEKGTKLNSTQAAAIMPHEYWNRNTTRSNAYVNGFIFRSYCRSLGLHPRFTGWSSTGPRSFGDFSSSAGYWKTLIDRPMYFNDGTYRDQQRINVSNFDNTMLTPEYAERTYPDYKIQEPNEARATRVGEAYAGELAGVKNSLKDNPNAAVGVNINDSTQAFTDEILRGLKTIETREAPLNAQHGSLNKYVGQRVGIVRTGKGKATVVGWATIAREIEYANEAEFRADYDRHRIAEGSSYDWHDGKKKFGYVLENVTEEAEPYEVTEKGIIARDVDRAAQDGVEEFGLKYSPKATEENFAALLEEQFKKEEKEKKKNKLTDVVIEYEVTPEQFREELEGIRANPRDTDYTFPVMRITPPVYNFALKRDWQRSLVMRADKALQAILTPEEAKALGFDPEKEDYHGLGIDGLVHAIYGIDDPEYIIEELEGRNKGRFLSVVEINGSDGVVVLDFNNQRIGKGGTIGSQNGFYDVAVTAYNKLNKATKKKFPNVKSFSELINLILDPTNKSYSKVYDKEENGDEFRAYLSDQLSRYGTQTPSSGDTVPQEKQSVKARDAEYLAAVERGDMETAQRMVDEAAERAFANSKIRDEDGKLLKVYHGTDAYFTVFDRTRGRSTMDIQGSFFSPWEIDAEGYGPNVRAFYLNIERPAPEGTVYRALNAFKGRNNAGVLARERLERLGYDGVNNSDEEYIAFNSNQIKSADPVTYDDAGNVIPLSERFNRDNSDIRYSQKDRSDREVLSDALMEAAQTEEERSQLREYQMWVKDLDAKQERLQLVNKKIKEISFGKGQRDSALLKTLTQEAAELKRTLNRYDKKLLEMEATSPLKAVMQRERDAAYKRAAEKGRAKLREYRIQRDQSEAVKKYRGRIEGSVKDLLRLVTENSDKRHVPDQLRQPLAEFLESINLESKQAQNGGPQTNRDMDWARRFERLQNALNAQRADEAEGKADVNLYLPDDFYDLLNQAAEAVRTFTDRYGNGESIYSTDAQTLRDMDRVLKILSHVVKSANETMVNNYAARISELGEKTMQQLNELGVAGVTKGIPGWLNNLIFWSNGTPYYVFKRFGDAGFSTFQAIMDGQGKLARIAEKVIEDSRQMFTSDEVKQWQDDVQDVELSDGRTVRMTTAQIMAFYCLSKRQQAVGHLLGGGMKIDAFKDGRKTVDDRTDYVLGVEDIQNINSLLTDRQREVADAIQKYMSTYGSELGNEVTMRRFGYKAYGETNYFPIVSDRQNLDGTKEEEQRQSLLRLLNMSHTKSLVDNANNALVVQNIFDVFANHMSDMAEYNALALPVLDMVRWFNYKNRQSTDKGQIVTDTVQKSLATAFGGYDKGKENVQSLANSYVKTFLKDLNGNNERGRDIGIGNLMSRYKRASVAANLRVAIQQPMSIMRAGAVLDYKWIAKGIRDAAASPRAMAEELSSWSNEAKWKDQGHHDIYIGRSVAEQIKNDQSIVDRAVEKSMIMAEIGDKVTWTALWAACKAEQESKGLTGEALLDATAKRFQEVVYATQVMDATTTRSQAMRSNSPMNQMWTAFMAEPTLSVNLLADSWMQYRLAARRGGDTTDARKAAFRATWRVAARAVTAYCFNALAVTLAESLMDAFRDDDDYETFVDKYMQALGENWLDELNPLSKVTVLKDILNIFTSKYGAGDRMDLAALTSAKKTLDIMIETYKVNVLGEKPTETTYYGKMTWYGKTYQLLKTVSQITGVPFAGLSREMQSVWNNMFYPGLKAAGVNDVQRLKTYNESAKNVGIPKLYDAIVEGDDKTALKLRTEMLYNGVDDETVVKGLREQIKEHYLSGDIDDEEATRLLVEYCGADPTATGGKSVNYKLDQWRYGSEFKMSDNLQAAFESGSAEEIRAAVQEQRTRYFRANKDIKEDCTSYWKERYQAGAANERTVRQMLMATGLYTSEDIDKLLKKWKNG